ncbi:sugar ABC transporter permease [Roseibium porphyridii]|uniref:Sugar ABC transporter permease n=1 Tax=Roseibium porphyridii TaxID=2866279 RepID=A0ABY8F9E9_9HYPH|nr:sugar ABC transporter permease [Roseibium sp. KMA01]WFE89870.1 sugar ABC transporter permease [Roseibium sp. KMA01]
MNEKNIFCYVMVAPALAITIVLGVYPMIDTMLISFQSYDLLTLQNEGTRWIGLDNYREILANEKFLQTISQTVIFTVLAVGISVAMGLFLAQIVNAEFRGRSVLRTIILSPWFVPPVVASAIWLWLLETNTSPINSILLDAGLIERKIRFLTDSDTIGPFSIPMLSIVAVRCWNGLPIIIIFLLAGLQSIPKSLYEAAEMDGGGVWAKFRYVTLPMLQPVLMVLFALLFLGGFGHFEMNYIMTGGGPRNLTNVLAVWTYQEGFQFLRYGKAAAAGGIVLVMCSIISVFYLWAQSKDNRS